MKTLVFFLVFFCFFQVTNGQASYEVHYDVQFNNNFDRSGPQIRQLEGILQINGGTDALFYLLPRFKIEQTDNQIEIPQDTLWRVRIAYGSGALYFEDLFNSSLKPLWFSDSLYPMVWNILDDVDERDSLLCQKAETSFRGRLYEAWFCPAYPLPFGPWKAGGLPGLIIQLEDKKGDLKMVATQIRQHPAPFIMPRLQARSYQEYLDRGNQVRKLIASNARSTDCLDCESKVAFYSWEKVFNSK